MKKVSLFDSGSLRAICFDSYEFETQDFSFSVRAAPGYYEPGYYNGGYCDPGYSPASLAGTMINRGLMRNGIDLWPLQASDCGDGNRVCQTGVALIRGGAPYRKETAFC